jgi:hypothetical protein
MGAWNVATGPGSKNTSGLSWGRENLTMTSQCPDGRTRRVLCRQGSAMREDCDARAACARGKSALPLTGPRKSGEGCIPLGLDTSCGNVSVPISHLPLHAYDSTSPILWRVCCPLPISKQQGCGWAPGERCWEQKRSVFSPFGTNVGAFMQPSCAHFLFTTSLCSDDLCFAQNLGPPFTPTSPKMGLVLHPAAPHLDAPGFRCGALSLEVFSLWPTPAFV